MSRYSFTGSGNLLLRATTAGKYNGEEYKANQPIMYLTGVNIALLFSSIDKVARAGVKNLTGATDTAASILNVSGIKTSEGLQTFLYRKETNNVRTITEVKNITSQDGVAYLPTHDSDIILSNFFIFKNNILVTDNITLGSDNTILGLDDGTHVIFYEKEITSPATYHFAEYSMPYCSAEISIQGNINGKTGTAVIHLPQLLLTTEPSLDFTSDDPFVQEMTFAIVGQLKTLEINYYG